MTKLKHRETIRHIMTETPVTVNLTTKISEAAQLFAKADYHHLPVLDGKKLVGIISFNDLMRLSYADAFDQNYADVWQALDHSKSIEDVMSREPETLTTDAMVRDAAEMLAESTFHAIPVVDSNGNLEGIVTSTDLIRFLAELY